MSGFHRAVPAHGCLRLPECRGQRLMELGRLLETLRSKKNTQKKNTELYYARSLGGFTLVLPPGETTPQGQSSAHPASVHSRCCRSRRAPHSEPRYYLGIYGGTVGARAPCACRATDISAFADCPGHAVELCACRCDYCRRLSRPFADRLTARTRARINCGRLSPPLITQPKQNP